MTLDFALLAQWQRNILGVARAPFRSGPAFAKGGRERYGLDTDTPARLEVCLAGSRDPALPVASRAARAYLDVCFFHPFADGNARSALLALAFVLAKEDIVLDQVGPLAQLQRPVDDPEAAKRMADLVVILIENTQRRFETSTQTARCRRSANRTSCSQANTVSQPRLDAPDPSRTRQFIHIQDSASTRHCRYVPREL